jgi:hypothetical protein
MLRLEKKGMGRSLVLRLAMLMPRVMIMWNDIWGYILRVGYGKTLPRLLVIEAIRASWPGWGCATSGANMESKYILLTWLLFADTISLIRCTRG